MESIATTQNDPRIVSRERFMGTAKRWRRFGEPIPAGGSVKADGTPDYGIFGPGSVAWDIILHPSVILFQTTAQGLLQLTYKPVFAAIRDVDPLGRKARAGTLTLFDAFDRSQRNSGIHAPMWLGDTATAQRVAQHLRQFHARVEGDVIDVGAPELGGYSANSSRDSMWAALTEIHSMLWLYEAFAFRKGWLPRRLPDSERDRLIAESADYVRLFGVPDDEIPHNMAELGALYEKYAAYFSHSDTLDILPDTGQHFKALVGEVMKKNFHKSQWRVVVVTLFQHSLFGPAVTGAVSAKTRRAIGIGPVKDVFCRLSTKLMLPFALLMQIRPIERYFMRLMWGPDAMMLIDSARKLHLQAKKAR